jgi:hypothetical protein
MVQHLVKYEMKTAINIMLKSFREQAVYSPETVIKQ